jgi:hypothetical protein
LAPDRLLRCFPAALPQENNLTGGLPPAWGNWERQSLPMLRMLNVSDNPQLGGGLPANWSRPGAFPSLKTL